MGPELSQEFSTETFCTHQAETESLVVILIVQRPAHGRYERTYSMKLTGQMVPPVVTGPRCLRVDRRSPTGARKIRKYSRLALAGRL